MTTRTRTLLSDGLAKLTLQSGYAAIMIFAFTRGLRATDLGIIAVAMLGPSTLYTWRAGHVMDRFGPKAVFVAANALRGLAFIAAPLVCRDLISLSILSALTGLLQQISQAAKLTLDARLVPAGERTAYNSERAFAGGLATIAGPPLAGLVGHALGGASALLLAGAPALVAALNLLAVPAPGAREFRPEAQLDEPAASRRSWAWLKGEADLLVLIASYCFLLAVLEMETPLVFPYVREAYARGVDLTGMLLGLCGVGSLAGAAAMRARRAPLPPAALTLFLVLDGSCLALAACAPPLPVAAAAFALLGVVSSVTAITVESQVQLRAPASLHAVLFSTMGLMSGAGGACLTLVSSALADTRGAGPVLRGCAAAEIAVGLAGTLLICQALPALARPRRTDEEPTRA